jgi:hypothetical protein
MALIAIGFDGVPEWLAHNKTQARDSLQRYFAPTAEGGFTGRWFEHFASLSDPLRLDANDIAACAALSVPISGRVLNALMDVNDHFADLMREAPPQDVTLRDVDDASISDGCALSSAYLLLRGIDGVGPVTASKLMASKRPHLVPIRDSVVEDVLRAGDRWWGPWKTLVSDPAVADLVDAVTPDHLIGSVSLLRRLDVILWMAGSGA